MRMFGVAGEHRTPKGCRINIYSGPFFQVYEASGLLRDGAKQVTLRTYYGDRVIARFPSGVVGPRTNTNYLAIDGAVSTALTNYYTGSTEGEQ